MHAMSRLPTGQTASDQSSPRSGRLVDFHQEQILFLQGELSEAPLWKPGAQRSQEPGRSFPPSPCFSLWSNYRDPARRQPCKGGWQRQKQPLRPKPNYAADCPTGGADQLVSSFQGLTLSKQNVEQNLLEILSDLKSGQTVSAHHLAHRLHVQKKVVNHHLYKLHHQGQLSRSGRTPPLWRLAEGRDVWEASQEGRPSIREERSCLLDLEIGEEGSSASYQEDSSIASPDMAEVKEKICGFLFGVVDSTAHNLAKNIGLNKAREVNAALLALEKLGEVHKENASPPKWSLTDNKRKRMQVKIKVEEVQQMVPPDAEPPAPCLEPEAPAHLPSPHPSPPPPPPPPPLPDEEEEKKIENGQQATELMEPGARRPRWGSPSRKRPRYYRFSLYDHFENSSWASDDIPEDMNAMSNQDESRYIMVSPLSPSYAAQFDTAFQCTPLEKLMACQKKNPVSGLIEYTQYMYQHCEFVLLKQSGPSHEPRFRYCVKVGEQIFPAVVSSSKKGAKQMAAEAAMKGLTGETIPSPEQTEAPSEPPLELQGGQLANPEEAKTVSAKGVGELIKYLNSNPVSGLLEYARANGFAAEFKLIDQTGPPHDPKFVFQAKVGGRWFPSVTAHSKKQGKQEAADAALRVLIGENEKAEHMAEGLGVTELPVSGSTLHDQIAMLSHQRFNALTARIQHSLLGRKILAAIIMRRGQEGLGVVVSIGTGNRCVKGEELSLKGETVNDCHAEIISRRGFIRFLYNELMEFDPSAPEGSIFQPTEDGKLKIKDDVSFHLYISEQANAAGEGQHQPLFENPKQGKLRTKVENGYLYSQGHLTRAICCRMSRDGNAFETRLPAPYLVNHPEVGRVSVYDSARQTGKTKESSINWPKLDMSRVSKQNLFVLFRLLCAKMGREDLQNFTVYSEAKGSAVPYQSAKQQFFWGLQEMGYGSWICKPQEEKTFVLPEPAAPPIL
ncbi:hypothetical protein Chor_005085 [Crotalus horridus]